MTITVIGLGLIGGSMAISLKKRGFASRVIGVDKNPEHGEMALELGIVDEVLPLELGVQQTDLVIIAIPVNALSKVVIPVLDAINRETIVLDVGSTKGAVCEAVKGHPKRKNFVACHPIAGTENTGPTAAFDGLFDKKINIICESEKSYNWALEKVNELFEDYLNMEQIYMNPVEHDRHIAYVSHLSHISSFTLGLTVLDIEKDEKNIFNMAGSGFASTVRLAKSSADMWVPIFEENAQNLSTALEAYIYQLGRFKQLIDEGNFALAHELIEKANEIRRVLDGIELKKKVIV